ncbi:SRPBCC family protein [Actinomycetospora aeridis]|uniref:SRPBCC family protein n=1 Tax=Actinomycetospora aeridis TaxID=3129231 RepID=A0ABU8N2S0_9PSEU
MSTDTTTEAVSATRRIEAPRESVFAVLADPASHAAIDGTGWVREALDAQPITEVGQIFGMGMFHSNHPDGDYRMHNRVEVLEPPRTIAWQPGQYGPDGEIGYGGWSWRYDLVEDGPGATQVTLRYDWSAVPPFLREHIAFPPFGEEHLRRSLDNLAALV